MNQTICLLLTLICLGCQRAPTVAPPKISSPAEVAAVAPAAIDVIASELNAESVEQAIPAEEIPKAEEIFTTLTANSWTNSPGKRPEFPDYSVSTFRADGSYSYEYFTDYHVPIKTGKWNLQFVRGRWYLCQDDGARRTIEVNDDGTITPFFGKLHPHEALARAGDETFDSLQPLELPLEVQTIARQMTAYTWKRANDLELRRYPTAIRFRPDWTYIALYRGNECKSVGTWYATAEKSGGMNPNGTCHGPPDQYGEQFAAKVLSDRELLVGQELYVPLDEPLPRGIFLIHGFGDLLNIRVEYDMPIRRGVPIHYDVTINNGSDRQRTGNSYTLKLERFSLSSEGSDYGRSLREPGTKPVIPAIEIAGLDLAGKTLDPGKSHAFRLTATLPKVGEQWIYFNTLVSGTTQNFDVSQVRGLDVKE